MFLQEQYGHYSLTDPFLALQRDFESGLPGGDKERRAMGSSPISVLEAVMAHCRKMQERMSAQLAAAESRQKRVRPSVRRSFTGLKLLWTDQSRKQARSSVDAGLVCTECVGVYYADSPQWPFVCSSSVLFFTLVLFIPLRLIIDVREFCVKGWQNNCGYVMEGKSCMMLCVCVCVSCP